MDFMIFGRIMGNFGLKQGFLGIWAQLLEDFCAFFEMIEYENQNCLIV